MPNSRYPCLCALIRKVERIAPRNYGNLLKPCGIKMWEQAQLEMQRVLDRENIEVMMKSVKKMLK